MLHRYFLFFFNDTATTEIYTLSLHDALPISPDHRNPYRASRVQLHPGDAERLHADGGGGPVCRCGGASRAPGDSGVKTRLRPQAGRIYGRRAFAPTPAVVAATLSRDA